MTRLGGYKSKVPTSKDYWAKPRKSMKRPPALYIVYAKSKYKEFCGCPFARMDYRGRFHGFEFRYYKKAIMYTRRYRAEWAAKNQVDRLDEYYNRGKKDKILFKIFKVEAEEKWTEAVERWVKEYNQLEVEGCKKKTL